jgi:E3 ubiquitin-protein ligase HUWE1
MSTTSEGMVVIQVSDLAQLGTSADMIFQHLVQEYKVPEEHQFQLLNRIRIATGISDPARRRQLLIIRILAIAVMSHIFSEPVMVEKFFAFEPEIIQSLTDLIHPDHNVSFVSQLERCHGIQCSLRYRVVTFSTEGTLINSDSFILYMIGLANGGALCFGWIGALEEQTARRVNDRECLSQPRCPTLCATQDHYRPGLG